MHSPTSLWFLQPLAICSRLRLIISSVSRWDFSEPAVVVDMCAVTRFWTLKPPGCTLLMARELKPFQQQHQLAKADWSYTWSKVSNIISMTRFVADTCIALVDRWIPLLVDMISAGETLLNSTLSRSLCWWRNMWKTRVLDSNQPYDTNDRLSNLAKFPVAKRFLSLSFMDFNVFTDTNIISMTRSRVTTQWISFRSLFGHYGPYVGGEHTLFS